MRSIIRVTRVSQSAKGSSFHARYVSERERDPEREEPASRPLFTRDQDGIKHTAADRHLASGKTPKPRDRDLLHVIIAFNSADARELERLAKERGKEARSKVDRSEIDRPWRGAKSEHLVGEEKEQARYERPDDGSKCDHPPRGPGRRPGFDDERRHSLQVERDRPYAEAVRGMVTNLEERTDLSNLQFVMAVHRHTSKTHVHLLLRREYTGKETGGRERLSNRLPKEFLNSKDERGKAKAGLIDESLSKALDTLIPDRRRTPRLIGLTQAQPPAVERVKEPTRPSPDPPPELPIRTTEDPATRLPEHASTGDDRRSSLRSLPSHRLPDLFDVRIPAGSTAQHPERPVPNDQSVTDRSDRLLTTIDHARDQYLTAVPRAAEHDPAEAARGNTISRAPARHRPQVGSGPTRSPAGTAAKDGRAAPEGQAKDQKRPSRSYSRGR